MGSNARVGRDIFIMAVLVIGIPAGLFAVGWLGLHWLDAALSEPIEQAEPVAATTPYEEPQPLAVPEEAPTPRELPDAEPNAGPLPTEPAGGLGSRGAAGIGATGGLIGTAAPSEPEELIAAGDAETEGEVFGLVEKLGKRDIVDGVKRNAASLKPCMQEARDSGLIGAGKRRLVLDFLIQADGSVTDVELKRPKRLRGTLAGVCVGRAVGEWRFPPSYEGAPIKNFPIPFKLK